MLFVHNGQKSRSTCMGNTNCDIFWEFVPFRRSVLLQTFSWFPHFQIILICTYSCLKILLIFSTFIRWKYQETWILRESNGMVFDIWIVLVKLIASRPQPSQVGCVTLRTQSHCLAEYQCKFWHGLRHDSGFLGSVRLWTGVSVPACM